MLRLQSVTANRIKILCQQLLYGIKFSIVYHWFKCRNIKPIIDFNEVDIISIYLTEKVIFIEAARPSRVSLLRVDKSLC